MAELKGIAKNPDFEKILELLEKNYPKAAIGLNNKNPLQLLVATILSAQCTDVRVNIVTQKLFRKYKTLEDFANAKPKDLEKEIHSTGFYHNKAKNIILACKKILRDFGGNVPGTMEELVLLNGVGRKTANIILWNAFGKVEGIAVDTHVFRLSKRLGFSKHKTPEKVELDLMELFPKEKWPVVSNLLISHGRKVCFARKPLCQRVWKPMPKGVGLRVNDKSFAKSKSIVSRKPNTLSEKCFLNKLCPSASNVMVFV